MADVKTDEDTVIARAALGSSCGDLQYVKSTSSTDGRAMEGA